MVRVDETFLRWFHDRHPGVTAATLARGVIVGDGRSTYQRLADAIPPGGRVLDLGCGDGYLMARLRDRGQPAADVIGVDLSAGELAAARARLPDLPLLCARAQALPIATGALTAVVSHLAWTLMSDLDAVADELARVLTPGGVFATIVGGGPRGDDAAAGLLALAVPFAAAAPMTPRLGELRGRTDVGLAALLSPARGFAPPAVVDLEVDLSGSADQVWDALAPAYHLAHLTAAARAALRAEFAAAAARWRRPDGQIAATLYARLVTAVRR